MKFQSKVTCLAIIVITLPFFLQPSNTQAITRWIDYSTGEYKFYEDGYTPTSTTQNKNDALEEFLFNQKLEKITKTRDKAFSFLLDDYVKNKQWKKLEELVTENLGDKEYARNLANSFRNNDAFETSKQSQFFIRAVNTKDWKLAEKILLGNGATYSYAIEIVDQWENEFGSNQKPIIKRKNLLKNIYNFENVDTVLYEIISLENSNSGGTWKFENCNNGGSIKFEFIDTSNLSFELITQIEDKTSIAAGWAISEKVNYTCQVFFEDSNGVKSNYINLQTMVKRMKQKNTVQELETSELIEALILILNDKSSPLYPLVTSLLNPN